MPHDKHIVSYGLRAFLDLRTKSLAITACVSVAVMQTKFSASAYILAMGAFVDSICQFFVSWLDHCKINRPRKEEIAIIDCPLLPKEILRLILSRLENPFTVSKCRLVCRFFNSAIIEYFHGKHRFPITHLEVGLMPWWMPADYGGFQISVKFAIPHGRRQLRQISRRTYTYSTSRTMELLYKIMENCRFLSKFDARAATLSRGVVFDTYILALDDYSLRLLAEMGSSKSSTHQANFDFIVENHYIHFHRVAFPRARTFIGKGIASQLALKLLSIPWKNRHRECYVPVEYTEGLMRQLGQTSALHDAHCLAHPNDEGKIAELYAGYLMRYKDEDLDAAFFNAFRDAAGPNGPTRPSVRNITWRYRDKTGSYMWQ